MMKLKTVVAMGVLVAFLTGISVAQRRTTTLGGTPSGARLPNAVSLGNSTGTAIHPLPSAKTAPNASKTTIKPNATTTPNASRVGTTAETLPDKATPPDAHGLGNHTVTIPGPIQ